MGEAAKCRTKDWKERVKGRFMAISARNAFEEYNFQRLLFLGIIRQERKQGHNGQGFGKAALFG